MGVALALAYIVFFLLSPGDLFPELAAYRPLVVLAALTVPLTVIARLEKPEIGKLRTQFLLVTLFFGFVSCSWFPHGGLRANLDAFLDVSTTVIAYYLGVVHFRSPGRLRMIRAALVAVALFVLANAWLEIPIARATADSTPYVLASGFEDNIEVRIRGLGMLNDPNMYGQLLLMILPFLFVAKKKTGLGAKGYLFAIAISALFIAGVFLSGSRGAETGFAVVIALYLIARFKEAGKVFAAVIVPLSLLLINVGTSRTVSMAGGLDRLAIWSDGMSFFKSSPLWGIGFNGFVEREDWTAHNSYLLCASELGMIGFFLWMSAVVVTMIQLNRVSKLQGEQNLDLARWATALKISLGGFLFTSYFLSCTYGLPFFLLLGMSGAVISLAGGDEAIPVRGTNWQGWSLGLCVGLITSIYIMLRLRMV